MPEVFLSQMEQTVLDWIGDHPGCKGQDVSDAFLTVPNGGISRMLAMFMDENLIEWGTEDRPSGWYVVGMF